MRTAIFALILLAAPASAQTDGDAAWNEVQQRSAEIASTQNCQVACRALESLSRATKRLCDIGPEHCEEAKAKLRDAEQRVRTTCPECDVKTGAAHVQPQEPPPPPQAYGGHPADTVSAQESSKRGGCAGCSSAPEPADFGAAALILLATVRRKRRPR